MCSDIYLGHVFRHVLRVVLRHAFRHVFGHACRHLPALRARLLGYFTLALAQHDVGRSVAHVPAWHRNLCLDMWLDMCPHIRARRPGCCRSRMGHTDIGHNYYVGHKCMRAGLGAAGAGREQRQQQAAR